VSCVHLHTQSRERKSRRDSKALDIAWTLRDPAVTGAIVGARDPKQVDGIIGAMDFRLSASENRRSGGLIGSLVRE
jgi:aryl-alcohol dehydrogenase-like predicted oxidoreductase